MQLDLSKKEHYDIATSLRGPDTESNALKCLFSSVVREAVVPKDKVFTHEYDSMYTGHVYGSLINTMDHARTFLKTHREAIGANYHYMSHQRKAFAALDEMYPKAGYAVYFNEVMSKICVEGSEHYPIFHRLYLPVI